MVRAVSLVYYFVVEALSHYYSAVVFAGIEGVIEYSGRESAEDVSSSEVNPGRLVVGLFSHSIDVKSWKLVAFSFPFGSVEVT